MHPLFLATALGDGCDPGVLLELRGALVALPLFSEGGEQPECEGGTGARQGTE